MTIEAYILAACAVVLTGISKSGFAGGLGVLGVPLVAVTMTPQAAAVILLPVIMGIDLLSVWRYRNDWRVRMIVPLLPGAALGTGLGMIGFSRIDPDLLRLMIGLLALCFVARFVLRRHQSSQPSQGNRLSIFLVSTLSGFAGFVALAGGPPVKGTLLSMNLSKSEFVGTNAFFFFVMNLAKGGGYMSLDLFSAESLQFSAALIPFLFVGVWLGFSLHKRISQERFVALAQCLLGLAGVNLVYLGASSLMAAPV